MTAVLLILLGVVCLLAGFAGCIAPAVPGPPIAFLALPLAGLAKGWAVFAPWFLLGMAALAAVVTVLDVAVPAWGAKRYGAGRAGVWGSVLGMIAGSVWFPPFGLFLGAYLGALAGELLARKRAAAALRASWGVFVGTMAGIVLKLAYCAAASVYFARAVWA